MKRKKSGRAKSGEYGGCSIITVKFWLKKRSQYEPWGTVLYHSESSISCLFINSAVSYAHFLLSTADIRYLSLKHLERIFSAQYHDNQRIGAVKLFTFNRLYHDFLSFAPVSTFSRWIFEENSELLEWIEQPHVSYQIDGANVENWFIIAHIASYLPQT